MTDYEFVTIWKVEAPLQTVFDAILHSERWPSWWRAVTEVQEVQLGQPDGIGSERRYTWRTALPYGLKFNVRVVRIDAPILMEGKATGEVIGTGLWRLRQEGNTTFVRYDWRVRTTKQWMNVLSPIMRPVFVYNHDVVMRWGAEGLANLLNVHVESLKGEPLRAAARTLETSNRLAGRQYISREERRAKRIPQGPCLSRPGKCSAAHRLVLRDGRRHQCTCAHLGWADFGHCRSDLVNMAGAQFVKCVMSAGQDNSPKRSGDKNTRGI